MPNIEHIDKTWEDVRARFLAKLADYGTKDIEEMGIAGLLSRIREKTMRLDNVVKNGSAVNDETMSDTGIDIMGYSLILNLVLRGQWTDEMPAASRVEQMRDEFYLMVRRDDKEHMGLLAPQKEGDVGYDLVVLQDTWVLPEYSLFNENDGYVMRGNPPVNVPVGISAKLPEGYWAEIRPRSSTATKLNLRVHQSVMDTGYTGPWYVVCASLTGRPQEIKKGTRIAQAILHRSNTPKLIDVPELPETARGATGFGSSGLNA